MASAVIFAVFLLLVGSRVESCALPGYLEVNVPQFLKAGYVVKTVNFSLCDTKSMHLTCTDDTFTVTRGGDIVVERPVYVSASGRTFSVSAVDSDGAGSKMKVHLVCTTQSEKTMKRVKRRWGPPPFNVLENDKGPFPKFLETIVSDSSATHNVYYTISGRGIDEEPTNVFSLESKTGALSMLQPIDRETYPRFEMVVEVFDVNTHQQTDLPLPIIVEVDDMNDNAPTVDGPLQFTVAEKSKIGTMVGKIIASDRDQEGTDHVKLRYSLLDGRGQFNIDSVTGVITTATNMLDRESKATYLIPVEIADLDGRAGALRTTATATISLSDVNDNPPTFKETSYSTNVQENSKETLILRIPVDDKDLINTPNWISQFIIKKGNEGGNFRIETDPKTNEGLLYVANGVDYEKNKIVDLEIMARNEADLTGTTAQWNTIPVKVAVGDMDEGPEFIPPTVRFHVKENTANGTVIGTYTAVDPETKSSSGISYYKVTDPAHWINVDKNTGQLRVANTIDRESKFVQDGIYNVTVKAVDASMKSGTGTVIIVVEDVNDNSPTILPGEKVICENEANNVVIVAEDHDQSPFSSPFIFSMPADSDGQWSVTRYNDTAATLTHSKNLPMGIHEVDIDVMDQQSLARVQTVQVRICECRNGVCLAKEKSVTFGPMGWLALLLPLLLLLLLCLLLIFFCMTKGEKREIDDSGDSGGILLKSNTEAPGEEVDSSLITVPTIVEPVTKGSVKGQMVSPGWPGATMGVQSQVDDGFYESKMVTTDAQEFYSGRYDSQYGQGGYLVSSGADLDHQYLAQNAGFLHNWQTNGRYLQQKVAFLGSEEDGRYADDIIHGYRFEGTGSAAGSVGCCSDYGDNNDMGFLNSLGPKFKTLADVCTKK